QARGLNCAWRDESWSLRPNVFGCLIQTEELTHPVYELLAVAAFAQHRDGVMQQLLHDCLREQLELRFLLCIETHAPNGLPDLRATDVLGPLCQCADGGRDLQLLPPHEEA